MASKHGSDGSVMFVVALRLMDLPNQHLQNREENLEKPLCGTSLCAYCHIPFSRRAAVIQHYESRICRPFLDRLNIWLVIPRQEVRRIFNTPISLSPSLAIATRRSWDERTQVYKCYLCISDHVGFRTLDDLNHHLTSPAHETKRYKCPYVDCNLPFSTLGGLVQHIETRTCHCITKYDSHHFYVLSEGFVKAPPTPITSESFHGHYIRGMAERTVRDWDYTGVSIRSRFAARGRWAWRWAVELPELFVRRHDIVYMGAVGLVLLLLWVYIWGWTMFR
ncbi:hypothetical protein Q9L58_006406 [Maublancomyces gigas]|uniref:C2H2-type domain-containing protein n=1 Tax=Discina gigas TaxID=1032678 RepID=A0ABR3GFJ6_9PEZI